MIHVVVLAAGAASRFGADKLRADVAGRPLLAVTLDTVLGAVDPGDVMVVIGAGHEHRRTIATDRRVRVVEAATATRGLRWSIHAALAAVDPACVGVVVVLGDDPLAALATGDVHAAASRRPGQPLAVRRRAARAPHPVYLPRAAWPSPPTADDDAGLRALLDTHDTTWLELPDAPSLDVDVPADLPLLVERIARA
jgi:molybdenum cofactor cytidylyltransferase